MILQIERLAFAYKKETPVLRDISFTANKGDVVCILGPNGTGKTTLLRCLLGLLRPQRGTFHVGGQNFFALTEKERAKMIAYVPQRSRLAFAYSVRDVVLMGRLAHVNTGSRYSKADQQIVMDCLDLLQITHLANRSFQELSGGERQMVLVARALAQRSSLLVMDEPTAGLDYSNQVKILKTIRDLSTQGYTVLMTSHFPDHAFLAGSAAILLRDGLIFSSGRPEDIVSSESLSSLYQTEICVVEAEADGQTFKVCIPLLDKEDVNNQ